MMNDQHHPPVGVGVDRLVGGADGRDTDDPVYEQAVQLVRAVGEARLSTLQRRLFIGYNRAANLLETMERHGVLGPPGRHGERKVRLEGDRMTAVDGRGAVHRPVGGGFRHQREVDWRRGYYCAVAALLREAGCVTPDVRMLYAAGGNAADADPQDAEVFTEHGLTPPGEAPPASRG